MNFWRWTMKKSWKTKSNKKTVRDESNTDVTLLQTQINRRAWNKKKNRWCDLTQERPNGMEWNTNGEQKNITYHKNTIHNNLQSSENSSVQNTIVYVNQFQYLFANFFLRAGDYDFINEQTCNESEYNEKKRCSHPLCTHLHFYDELTWGVTANRHLNFDEIRKLRNSYRFYFSVVFRWHLRHRPAANRSFRWPKYWPAILHESI